jgi:hypothetical protein
MKGHDMNVRSAAGKPGRSITRGVRDSATTHRTSGALAVLAATGAVALAACGSGGSPHVASLRTTTTSSGTSSGNVAGGPATALPTGNATQLLDHWAACMRRHGDPEQADPTIEVNRVIHITWNPATPGGLYGTFKGEQGNTGPGQYCRSYLTAAQVALTASQHQKPPDRAQVAKYSQCMRADGIPDFPDPSADGLLLNFGPGSDLNPTDPSFQNASKLCDHKTGVNLFSGTPQPGTIQLDGGGPGGAGG